MKEELNTKESSKDTIKSGLLIMRISFAVCFLINMLIPLYYPIKFGFSFVTNWIAVILHFVELLSFTGYGGQKAKLKSIFAVRVIQSIYFIFICKKDVIWFSFITIVVIDFLFFIVLMIDKSRYEYIEEDENVEEL